MKACVGQQDTEVGVGWRDSFSDDVDLFLAEENDGACARLQEFGFGSTDRANFASHLDILDHHGKRSGLAMFANSQFVYRSVRTSIAYQMVASQSFECADAPLTNCLDETGERIATILEPVSGFNESEMRATFWTANGLCMKATIEWIVKLHSAGSAQIELGHGCARTIKGSALNNCESRPAVGAIEKWIAIASIGRIKEFVQAIVTGADIGGDKYGFVF
jgi:hypothetical protein